MSTLQLDKLRTLALTMCAKSEEVNSLAEAVAQLPMLRELYVLCTSIHAGPLVPGFLTDVTSRLSNRSSITTLGVTLNVHSPHLITIPASALAGITALELNEGVAVEGVLDSLASLRLNIQTHDDAAARHMLTHLQRSPAVALTMQQPVSQLLVPDNLQSLTLVEPFDRQQLDQQEVSNALRSLPQLRKLQIGNFLTNSIVNELLSVSLPSLVTFGF